MNDQKPPESHMEAAARARAVPLVGGPGQMGDAGGAAFGQPAGLAGPDAETVLAAAAAVLTEGMPLPRHEDLETVTALLCGHLSGLVMEVAAAAGPPVGDAAALVAVREARHRMAADPGPGLVSAIRHAQCLARSCRALVQQRARLRAARDSGPSG